MPQPGELLYVLDGGALLRRIPWKYGAFGDICSFYVHYTQWNDANCWNTHEMTGAPNEKEYEKGLEYSFPLYHIVLWPFKRLFVRANIIWSVRMR